MTNWRQNMRVLAKLEGERTGAQIADALARVDASRGGPLLSRLDADDLETVVAAAAELWSGVVPTELSECQREVMNRASGQAGALLEAEYRALRDLAEAVRAELAGDTCAECGRELLRDAPTSPPYDREAQSLYCHHTGGRHVSLAERLAAEAGQARGAAAGRSAGGALALEAPAAAAKESTTFSRRGAVMAGLPEPLDPADAARRIGESRQVIRDTEDALRSARDTYGAGSEQVKRVHQAFLDAQQKVIEACRADEPVRVRRSDLAYLLAHYRWELDGADPGHWQMPLLTSVCERLADAASPAQPPSASPGA